jgi:hypothetical protein
MTVISVSRSILGAEFLVLPPCRDEDDTAAAMLIREHAPHRHGAGVVFLFFCICAIDGADYVFERRELVVLDRLPELPPISLKDATAAGGGRLLQAARRRVGAQAGL